MPCGCAQIVFLSAGSLSRNSAVDVDLEGNFEFDGKLVRYSIVSDLVDPTLLICRGAVMGAEVNERVMLWPDLHVRHDWHDCRYNTCHKDKVNRAGFAGGSNF